MWWQHGLKTVPSKREDLFRKFFIRFICLIWWPIAIRSRFIIVTFYVNDQFGTILSNKCIANWWITKKFGWSKKITKKKINFFTFTIGNILSFVSNSSMSENRLNILNYSELSNDHSHDLTIVNTFSMHR